MSTNFCHLSSLALTFGCYMGTSVMWLKLLFPLWYLSVTWELVFSLSLGDRGITLHSAMAMRWNNTAHLWLQERVLAGPQPYRVQLVATVSPHPSECVTVSFWLTWSDSFSLSKQNACLLQSFVIVCDFSFEIPIASPVSNTIFLLPIFNQSACEHLVGSHSTIKEP